MMIRSGESALERLAGLLSSCKEADASAKETVKKTVLKINEERTNIKLKMHIDTKYGSIMDYFEIFLARMTLCRRAAQKLGLEFKLIINEQTLL